MQVSTSVGSGISSHDSNKHSVFPEGHLLPFVFVTVLFFLWGMSNNLTDILVQQFRKSFELSQFSAQLVQTANFFGYFCMAIPAALLMRRWGYKAGMVTGLVMFGTGMVLFWPAAVSGQYGLFLAALFTVGCGASILETAANPFIAQFGDPATSEQRLNFSQSFNPPGTITGVLIGTYFIFSGVEKNQVEVAAMKAAGTYPAYLHTEIMRVVPTYLTFGAVVLLCAFVLSRTKFPVIQVEHEGAGENHGSFAELLRIPAIWIAVAANFCNVGAQISSWSSLIPYMKQYTAVSERSAALYLLSTLIAHGDWAVCFDSVDAFCAAKSDAGHVWRDERFADAGGGEQTWNCGCLCGGGERVLYLDHVSHHLCAGLEGAGAEYEDRRVAAGDGDCWRCDLSSGAWVDCQAYGESGAGICGAACGICWSGGVWVLSGYAAVFAVGA